MPISPLSLRGSLRYKARYKTAVWLGSLSSWGNGRDAQSWPSGHVYLPTASHGQPVQIVFCFFVFLVCLDITLKDVLLSLAFFFIVLVFYNRKLTKFKLCFKDTPSFCKPVSTCSQLFSNESKGPGFPTDSDFPNPCLSIHCTKNQEHVSQLSI